MVFLDAEFARIRAQVDGWNAAARPFRGYRAHENRERCHAEGRRRMARKLGLEGL